MSYISDFTILNYEDIELPCDFIDNKILEQLKNKNKKRIEYLESLTEDVMTVSEFKELKSLKRDEVKKEPIINKYNYKVVYFANIDLLNKNFYRYFYDRDYQENLFFASVDKNDDIVLFSAFGDQIGQFNKKEDKLVLLNLGTIRDNLGLVKNKVLKLIKDFKINTTIVDLGDEEYGFVEENGCNRELKNITFINGIRVF